MKHSGELMVVQICPYDVIMTPVADIAAGVRIGDMDWWIEGWIDVVNAPKEPWAAFKHTGERPGWGKHSTKDLTP